MPQTPPRRARSPARTTKPAEKHPAELSRRASMGGTEYSPHTQLYLQLAVFLDLFGVMLVVPNLIHRFTELGISTAQYSLVSSVYSASQIVGSLVIGYLGDNSLGRKRALQLSFIGAAVSYLLVGIAEDLSLLVLSRVIVGLVKQTQSTAAALVTQLSEPETRAQALARLASAGTLANLCGSSIGGYLSKRYGRRTPCFLAAALFAADLVLVHVLFPDTRPKRRPAATPSDAGASASAAAASSATTSAAPAAASTPPPARKQRLNLGGFEAAFSGAGGRLLALRLCYAFLMRSVYSLHSMYELERWQLSAAHTGYLFSYKTVLSLMVERLAVGRLAARLPEAWLLQAAVATAALNSLCEASHGSFALYALLNQPVSAFCTAVTRACLSSLFSKAVPVADSGAALSAFDVGSSAAGILSPLYGGLLLSRLGVASQPAVAAAHYVVLLGLSAAVLARNATAAAAAAAAEGEAAGAAARKKKVV